MSLYDHDFYQRDRQQNDTPGKCLDRMVDAILDSDEITLYDKVQDFWYQEWELSMLKDPGEKDVLRYALKACLVEKMVEIWGMPPKNKKDFAPLWCKNVSAYEAGFLVIEERYKKYFIEEMSPVFQKRNIFAPKDYLFFV